MTPSKNDDNPDDGLSGSAYRMLLGAALVAIELGHSAIASRMARNLTLLRPDLPQASTVDVMCDFLQDRAHAGMARLQSILDAFPDYQMGAALLATAMKNKGIGGWQTILEEVIDDGRDEFAIGLARELLGRDLMTTLEAARPDSYK